MFTIPASGGSAMFVSVRVHFQKNAGLGTDFFYAVMRSAAAATSNVRAVCEVTSSTEAFRTCGMQCAESTQRNAFVDDGRPAGGEPYRTSRHRAPVGRGLDFPRSAGSTLSRSRQQSRTDPGEQFLPRSHRNDNAGNIGNFLPRC